MVGAGVAHDRHPRDLRVVGDDALDLERVDVEAAADVHLAGATAQHEVAVVAQAPEVAGGDPAVGRQRVGGALGVVPVAAHAARGTQRDHADLAVGHRRAAFVAQHELDAVLRSADGVQQDLGRIADARAGDRRRLRARVADDDRAAEAGAHLLGELGRDRRRAGRREPQRRQIDVGQLGQVDELAPLGGHALADGHALAHHAVEHRLDRPRGAGEHRVDDELDLVPQLVHVARVRERHRHQADVVVRAEDVAEPGRRLHGAVVEPRALGQAGRPAGPDDADRVAGITAGPIGELGAGGPRRGHLGARHHHLGGGCAAGDRERVALVQQRHRLAALEDRGDLAGTEARVDAGGDRAERVHAAYATA